MENNEMILVPYEDFIAGQRAIATLTTVEGIVMKAFNHKTYDPSSEKIEAIRAILSICEVR